MKWLEFLKAHKQRAEEQAKGKAVLKPRHIRRLKKLWENKYLDKNGNTLNALFEVSYSEAIEVAYKMESPLLKLIKKNNFTGNLYNVPIILSLK